MIEWFIKTEEAGKECKEMGWADYVIVNREKGKNKSYTRRHYENLDEIASGQTSNTNYSLRSCAVRNGDELRAACEHGEIDIVTIGETFEGRVNAASERSIKKGLTTNKVFEVLLAPAVSSRYTRQAFIDMLKQFVKYTNGKNLLISSSASSAYQLRRPPDMANLLTLGGLPFPKATTVLRETNLHLTTVIRNKESKYGVLAVSPKQAQEKTNREAQLAYERLKNKPVVKGKDEEQNVSPIPEKPKSKASFSDSDSETTGGGEVALAPIPEKPKSKASFSDSDSDTPAPRREAVSQPPKKKQKIVKKTIVAKKVVKK